MKHIFSIVFISLYIISFGQSYSFFPKWEKGDSKTIRITYTETEYENDELVSDTTYFSDASVSVIGEDKDFVTIQVLYENIALTSVIAFYEKLNEELNDYNTLKLIYKIDKKTGEYSLSNWKSAQRFMNESFDQITDLMKTKVPEMETFAELIFLPIKEIFKSKENIESYYKDQIGFLFVPFGKKFELGKTISISETSENPFNPEQEITQVTNILLKEIDKGRGVAIFEQDIELDLDEFIEMMKDMMLSMYKSFDLDEDDAKEQQEELDDFDMSMDNKQTITYDLNTNWVSKAESFGEVSVVSPDTKKRSIVNTTYLIK